MLQLLLSGMPQVKYSFICIPALWHICKITTEKLFHWPFFEHIYQGLSGHDVRERTPRFEFALMYLTKIHIAVATDEQVIAKYFSDTLASVNSPSIEWYIRITKLFVFTTIPFVWLLLFDLLLVARLLNSYSAVQLG